MADARKIPGFDAASIEREIDEEQGELGTEVLISRPDSEGAELQDGREDRAEPPQPERGYRNLNE